MGIHTEVHKKHAKIEFENNVKVALLNNINTLKQLM